MSVPSRPIPALYTVYVLRSTMRHASLYIGSTTDPPRRLKQHNGAIKGGAVRTSRASLRPWEMVALVSGFPGAVAALQFEWALTNPHLSLHIPADARLSVARQTKKNGHPRRPPASLPSIVANLHLLLRVPSFVRWPLRLHVFAPDVHAAWAARCAATAVAPDVEVVTDFGGGGGSLDDHRPPPPHGIHALPLDYTPLRDYVDKARDIFTFERADACAVCRGPLPPGRGLYAVCPNAGCEAAGHLRCWGRHVLAEGADVPTTSGPDRPDQPDQPDRLNAVLPVRGHCPSCGGPVVWADMMKELTLRVRAPSEVDKLVRAKRQQEKQQDKAAADEASAAPEAAATSTLMKKAKAAKTATSKTAKPATTKTATAKTAKTATKPRRTKGAPGAGADAAIGLLGRSASPEVIII